MWRGGKMARRDDGQAGGTMISEIAKWVGHVVLRDGESSGRC